MKTYMNVHISLDSPYKWGSGYSEATDDEIKSNEAYLYSLMEYIGFICGEQPSKFSSPVFYNEENKFEEIYLHPMELAGTMSLKTKEKIVKYFNENPSSVTKINRIIERNVERPYTFIEVVNQLTFLSGLSNDSEIWTKILNKYPCGAPMNCNYGLLQFDFKEIHFIPMIDNLLTAQKTFVYRWLNEQIEMRMIQK